MFKTTYTFKLIVATWVWKKHVRYNTKKRLINTTNVIDEYKNKTVSRIIFLKKIGKNYSNKWFIELS
jgi:hypothetical protein